MPRFRYCFACPWFKNGRVPRLTVATPERDGLSLDDARRAVGIIAASGPVAGFGASAAMFGEGADPEPTVAAVALLAEAALGSPAA